MVDADRATCPRCGVPLPADDLAGLCLHCLLSDTQGDRIEIPPVKPSSPGRVRRNLTLTLASAGTAIGAILLGELWFENRREQPADAKALFTFGNALSRQGKLEEAIAAYREAIRIKPDSATHLNLGTALQTRGKLEEAVTEFRTAIRIKPNYARAHYNLGNALRNQGKLAKAEAAYRTALKLKPDYAEAFYNLGTTLNDQGKLEEAIAAYRKVIQIKPDLVPAHNNLARALVLSPKRPRRDYDEGLVHARKAVELASKKGFTYATLALAEYRLGHWTESVAANKRSLALKNGGDAINWFILAMAHWQKGDKDQARTWFDKAVVWMKQNAPKDADLRQLWAEAAGLLGQPGLDAPGERSRTAPTAEKPR